MYILTYLSCYPTLILWISSIISSIIPPIISPIIFSYLSLYLSLYLSNYLFNYPSNYLTNYLLLSHVTVVVMYPYMPICILLSLWWGGVVVLRHFLLSSSMRALSLHIYPPSHIVSSYTCTIITSSKLAFLVEHELSYSINISIADLCICSNARYIRCLGAWLIIPFIHVFYKQV